MKMNMATTGDHAIDHERLRENDRDTLGSIAAMRTHQ